MKCYNIGGQWSLSDKTGEPKPFRNKNSTPDMGGRNSGETEDLCKFSINGFMKAAGQPELETLPLPEGERRLFSLWRK